VTKNENGALQTQISAPCYNLPHQNTTVARNVRFYRSIALLNPLYDSSIAPSSPPQHQHLLWEPTQWKLQPQRLQANMGRNALVQHRCWSHYYQEDAE
jgi:hypothetical protein